MSVNSVICVEVIYLSDRWQRNDLFLSSDCRLTPVLLQGLYFFLFKRRLCRLTFCVGPLGRASWRS